MAFQDTPTKYIILDTPTLEHAYTVIFGYAYTLEDAYKIYIFGYAYFRTRLQNMYFLIHQFRTRLQNIYFWIRLL